GGCVARAQGGGGQRRRDGCLLRGGGKEGRHPPRVAGPACDLSARARARLANLGFQVFRRLSSSRMILRDRQYKAFERLLNWACKALHIAVAHGVAIFRHCSCFLIENEPGKASYSKLYAFA